MRRGRVLCLAALLCSGGAWGQVSSGFGTITGKVVDSGGEGIPDIRIVLSNETLGTERTVTTSDDGIFNMTAVVPLTGYHVQAARARGLGWEQGNLTISAGQTLRFAITLPSEGNTQDMPEGEVRLVQDQQIGLDQVVARLQVETTPSSGRRIDPLISLAPAVVTNTAAPGSFVFHSQPYLNNVLTDGLSTTNLYSLGKPGVANQLSLDGVQDFEVASAVFPAEFGWTSGAVVNIATRSGTTEYHGEAYDYFRPRFLQAFDRYAAGYDVRQRQHQGGVNVGGPIAGEQLFFFVNADLLSRSGQGLNRITNPLIADPSGSRVLASNCQATAAQCFLATRYLQSQMNAMVPLWEHSARGLAKIDYRRSDRNSLSFAANALNWHAPAGAESELVAPNGGLLGGGILRDQTRYVKGGWTATGGSQFVNSLRLGWFQDRLTADPSAPLGLSSGLAGITIAGTTVGVSQPYSAILPSEHRAELAEDVNWTWGGHSFKAGFGYSRNSDHISSLTNAAGWYSYASLTSFAQDFARTGLRSYTAYTQTLGNPDRSVLWKELGVYLQDTWRAGRHLTFDLGLRYEHTRMPVPSNINFSFFQTATIPSPGLDLAPRFGVAYAWNERTVIRGAFGFYYAPFQGQLLDALVLGNAQDQTRITLNPDQSAAPLFPNFIPSSSVPTGTATVTYATSKFRNPLAQEGTVAIERQVGSTTTVTLSYLRVRGRRMWTTQDTNLAGATQSVSYTILNANGQPSGTYVTPITTGRNGTNVGHVYQIENQGSTWYDAASLQIVKRLSHGVSVSGTYTWSHARDNLGQAALFGTAASSTSNADYASDKGNSAFDQRNRGVMQWTWQPNSRASGSAAHFLLNHWQFSGLATLGSSQHATPVVIVQGQQFSTVTMLYTNSLNGGGGWARVPFLPVNSLETGPVYNVDARLARQIPITERIRATLLFEAFNVLNKQYNTQVNTIAYTAVPSLVNGQRSGTLVPVSGLGSGIAAQGFPDGTNARRCQIALRVTF